MKKILITIFISFTLVIASILAYNKIKSDKINNEILFNRVLGGVYTSYDDSSYENRFVVLYVTDFGCAHMWSTSGICLTRLYLKSYRLDNWHGSTYGWDGRDLKDFEKQYKYLYRYKENK
jgi:hypothetical protein